MSEAERPTCGTCLYGNPTKGEFVECHRNAPMPYVVMNGSDESDSATGWFPETLHDEFCGEHPDFPAYIATRRAPITPPPDIEASKEGDE